MALVQQDPLVSPPLDHDPAGGRSEDGRRLRAEHRRVVRLQPGGGKRAEPPDGVQLGGRVSQGRRRHPRNPLQHPGGHLDGTAQLPTPIPERPQTLLGPIHRHVRIGAQPQTRERSLPVNSHDSALHLFTDMSQNFIYKKIQFVYREFRKAKNGCPNLGQPQRAGLCQCALEMLNQAPPFLMPSPPAPDCPNLGQHKTFLEEK